LIKPICFGSLRAPASVPDSLFAGGLIGSNLDKTAQSGFDRGPLGSSASRLHRLPHQLVVDLDIGPHRRASRCVRLARFMCMRQRDSLSTEQSHLNRCRVRALYIAEKLIGHRKDKKRQGTASAVPKVAKKKPGFSL
jgi:hypothetical protein